MKIKNKSKKILFSVLLLAIIANFGILGLNHAHAAIPIGSPPTDSLNDRDDQGSWLSSLWNGITDAAAAIAQIPRGISTMIGDNLMLWVSGLFAFVLKMGIVIAMILLEIAGHLFSWSIDPKTLEAVLTHKEVYATWMIVRDVLNIGFILTLLFSAFCTIFQVESFNAKKIVVKLVIMALLVNFSFPIARFIIDFANVLMYEIVRATGFSGSGLSAFTETGVVKKVYDASMLADGTQTGYLFMTMIFFFALVVPILMIAMLFVIRTIMLVFLIIFSPVAFVGFAVPIFSGYASMWWKKLFEYAFFGPIMIFMMYVALKLMLAFSDTVSTSDAEISFGQFFMSYAILFAIPIVILFAGISIAQSMKIIGAAQAQKYATKAAKWGSGLAFGTAALKAYQTRGAEGDKNAISNRLGSWASRKTDKWESKLPGAGGRKATINLGEGVSGRIQDAATQFRVANKTSGELDAMLKPAGSKFADKFAIMAAATQLAERKELNLENPTHMEAYKTFQQFGTNGKPFIDINDKLKTYAPVAAISHLAPEKQAGALTEIVKSDKFDAKNLNTASLRDERLMKTMFENNRVSSKDLKEIGEKSTDHRMAVESSLLANSKNFSKSYTEDEQKILENKKKHEINQGYNKTLFNQTGKIENDVFEGDIYKSFNKDNAGKINKDLINKFKTNKEQAKKLVDNLKAKELSSVVTSMKGELANDFFDVVNTAMADTANAISVQRTAANSPALVGYRKNGSNSQKHIKSDWK